MKIAFTVALATLSFAALSFAAPSSAAPSFESLKQQAVPLDRPAQAIAVLVGACDAGDGAVNGECLENTQALKQKVQNQRVVMDLGSRYEQLLSFQGRRGDKARIVWAPLYDVGNGLALTVGRPQKISASGNVVIGKRPFDGHSPDTYTDLDLKRLGATGQLGIQVVGKFGRPWSMNGGGKTVRGVAFELEAIRIYHSRNGKTLFESVQPFK